MQFAKTAENFQIEGQVPDYSDRVLTAFRFVRVPHDGKILMDNCTNGVRMEGDYYHAS